MAKQTDRQLLLTMLDLLQFMELIDAPDSHYCEEFGVHYIREIKDLVGKRETAASLKRAQEQLREIDLDGCYYNED